MMATEKTQGLLRFERQDRVPYRLVDLFAGGGGASLGIKQALGVAPLFALNHDELAIAMHKANHPETEHAISDVFEVDPRSNQLAYLRELDALWASPDCRHFSKAKGARPVSNRVRGLAWAAVSWAKARTPRIIFLENVEEFQSWGPIHRDKNHAEYMRPIKSRKGETFRKFIGKLESLGYVVEWRVLNAADFGTPTIRKRLFMVARRDGQPIVWPTPTHGEGLEPYRTAAECIDWTEPTNSIFGRKRELADKTKARIAHGIVRYVINDPAPYLAPLQGEDVAPFFVPRYGERPTQPPRTRRITRPMPTVVSTGNGASLVATTLTKFYGTSKTSDIKAPLGTVTSGGKKFGLVSALLSKHYGGVVGTRLDVPMGTVSARDSQAVTAARLEYLSTPNVQTDRVAKFLQEHYGKSLGTRKGKDKSCGVGGPLDSIVTKDGLSLVLVTIDGEQYAITDIGMRMLQPNELAAAQGFPADYKLIGTKTQQVAKIGNSVPPPVVRALVEANVLDGRVAFAA